MKNNILEQKIEALNSANEYMDKLIGAIEHIIPEIRNENIEGCGNTLADIFDGIKWVYDVVNLTKECQKTEVNANEIDCFLEEMLEAFNDEDFILMSDLFQYEVLPILNKWNECIKISVAN